MSSMNGEPLAVFVKASDAGVYVPKAVGIPKSLLGSKLSGIHSTSVGPRGSAFTTTVPKRIIHVNTLQRYLKV